MPRHRAPSPHRPRVRLPGLAVALVAALSLGACGLRLETPPPAEPSPDATEQVRGRTVDDALALAEAAGTAAAGAPDPVRLVLDDVAAFSTRHAEELGGVYDSGLPDPTPTASPVPTPPGVADVAGLLAELVDGAARAAGDADDVPDADLARLVASVAVSRGSLAGRLAAAAGLPVPTASDDAASGGPPGDATAAPDEAVTPDTTAAPDVTATPGDAPAVPTSREAAALALAHDEAAWTYTVLAARTSDAARAAMLDAAARHRAASDVWARTAGIAGQPTDPRRAAYALPAGLDDPAVAQALPRTLEQTVAVASATVVAASPAGARGDAVDALRTATTAALAWGAAAVPFPGMPELAPAPVG